MDDRLPVFGENVLDVARGCLLRGGEPVHLRPQAYEVLKFLVEHRGRLVTKDALIDAVWEGRAVSDDSLVQCLRDVRQALGEGADLHIRTIRGRGYICESPPPGVEEPSPSTEPSGRSGLRRPFVARAILAMAGLLALATGGYWLATARSAATPIRTIVVLPLVNEGEDADAEYLTDGLTESLIASLSQVPGLAVKARSSVFRYRGAGIDPRQVARDLQVQAVLIGRLVQRGDEITVFLSLVDGATGNQLWGERYVRSGRDLAAVQDDVARDVARRLETRIAGAAPGAGGDRRVNPGAYLLYVRGRHHARKNTEPELRRAIEFYQQAIDADPTYALAHAALADAYRALPIVGHIPSNEAFPQARAAARQALAIDDGVAEAHVALGWIAFSFDWDWPEAERHLRRAIELSPDNADGHRAYAHLLSNLGRHEEALAEVLRARELDPLWLLVNALEGQFLFYAGRLDEAEFRFRKTLELDPNYWVAHNGIGRVLLHRGAYEEAAQAFRRARDLSSGSVEPVAQLGYALARGNRRAEARAVLQELASLPRDRYVPAYNFAMIHNGLDEREEALRQLERSLEAREVQLTFLRIDTRWDHVREDARFRAIARGVGLD